MIKRDAIVLFVTGDIVFDIAMTGPLISEELILRSGVFFLLVINYNS